MTRSAWSTAPDGRYIRVIRVYPHQIGACQRKRDAMARALAIASAHGLGILAENARTGRLELIASGAY